MHVVSSNDRRKIIQYLFLRVAEADTTDREADSVAKKLAIIVPGVFSGRLKLLALKF